MRRGLNTRSGHEDEAGLDLRAQTLEQSEIQEGRREEGKGAKGPKPQAR